MHSRKSNGTSLLIDVAIQGILVFVICFAGVTCPAKDSSEKLFGKTNLVAWCIVPFDAKKRGPEERAAMLEKLGIKLFAYDYRGEHIPTFDAEMEALHRHKIRLLAWWCPTTLNDEARTILKTLERHQLRQVQLWVTGGGGATSDREDQRKRVEAEAERIKTIAVAAQAIGCTVGLYNHGGWFGEPENQIEIIERLKRQNIQNIGIVYNQHHGHDQLPRFSELLQRMKPYLLALNLNGMSRDGDKTGNKIMPIGQGEEDVKLLQIIAASGYRGPIGILNHTDEDAEGRLLDNLEGLEWVTKQIQKKKPSPKPTPKTWRVSPQPKLQP